MPLLMITPLEEERSLLAQSLRAQGYSERMQSVGKLIGQCFPTLGVTLVLGGHGKAQAAHQTQHAIDHSERLDLVICAGAAGALVPGIAAGDLVVAETTIEHDLPAEIWRASRPAICRVPGDRGQATKQSSSSASSTSALWDHCQWG
jgi:nucleoside phosphorylase